MTFKKFFIFFLMLLLTIQTAVFAKSKEKEIPIEERIKIEVAVDDKTNFVELDTAELLRGMIIDNLEDAKIFNIPNAPEGCTSDIKNLDGKSADVGELILFAPTKSDKAGSTSDIDNEIYNDLGVDYIVRCEVLGLGRTKTDADSFGLGQGIGVGIGSGRHSHFGIGVFGTVGTSRKTVFATVVNAQFIKVDTKTILFQFNAIGEAFIPHKKSKGYDDPNNEAYLKSIKNAAKKISERVEKYTKNHLVKKDESKKK